MMLRRFSHGVRELAGMSCGATAEVCFRPHYGAGLGTSFLRPPLSRAVREHIVSRDGFANHWKAANLQRLIKCDCT